LSIVETSRVLAPLLNLVEVAAVGIGWFVGLFGGSRPINMPRHCQASGWGGPGRDCQDLNVSHSTISQLA
jgi:hypothetical protein